MRTLLALLLCSPALGWSAEIYLCKAYSGGSFWSSVHCHKQSATIQRIVTVPDGMPFDQQVHLGQAAAAEGSRLAAPPHVVQPAVTSGSGFSQQSECQALDAQIRSLDSMARQPRSGASQDRITQKRKAARDRQSQLGCR
jgi:hypothetical protein